MQLTRKCLSRSSCRVDSGASGSPQHFANGARGRLCPAGNTLLVSVQRMPLTGQRHPQTTCSAGWAGRGQAGTAEPVSYTHLTLPTIC
eukprot:7874912-Alexandrium_andersonii.AAC.1